MLTRMAVYEHEDRRGACDTSQAHQQGDQDAKAQVEALEEAMQAIQTRRYVEGVRSSPMLKLTIVGNLGSDPEMRYSAEGRPVLSVRVASHYRTRTPEGVWEDKTEWVRVRVVGQRAESLSQYLKKGSRVYVDGRLEARPWLNNQQQPQAGLEVFANDVEFMSSRSDDEQRRGDEGGDAPQAEASAGRPGVPTTRPAPQARPDPIDAGDLEDVPF